MLTVITGPMFAGKTSALISMVKANLIAGNEIEAFTPSNDTRYGLEVIASHDGEEINAEVLDKMSPFKSYFIEDMRKTKAVAFFEECQFFNVPSLMLLIKNLLDDGRDVVCAGLPNDSFGEPFGAMPQLLSIADEIISLKAVCSKCKKINKATRTFRKSDSKEQVVVGGKDIYEPRCFDCWRK